jgi:cell division protein FtsI (penicillin-binding protein 3)
VKNIESKVVTVEKSYADYYKKAQNTTDYIPNVKGMEGMDAIALLENLGLKVKVVGIGKVKAQSINAGEIIQKNQVITLQLS